MSAAVCLGRIYLATAHVRQCPGVDAPSCQHGCAGGWCSAAVQVCFGMIVFGRQVVPTRWDPGPHGKICAVYSSGRISQTNEPPLTCSCCAGGYLQYIFRTAARELYGIDVPWSEPLPLKVLRNEDFQEVVLERDGRAVLRFALAYGFRNIQTIVSHAILEVPVYCPFILSSSSVSGTAPVLHRGHQGLSFPSDSKTA